MRRKLITLVLVVAGAAALVALPASAAPRGTNGKLIVNVDNSATGTEQVYTVNPDSNDHQLLFDNAEAGQWSPDGRRVGLVSSSGEQLILNVDTGAITDLGQSLSARYPDLALFCGVWSPDGSRLACEGFGQTDGSLNGVYTVRSSDGGDLQRVTSEPNGDDCPSDYSPDGKRLVVTRASDTSYAIDTVKLDGSGLKQITPSGTDFDFCTGNWSPQGNQILYSAHVPDSDRSTIWVAHADGTGVQEIPIPGCGGPRSDSSSIGCSDPVWSPDGQKIAFSRHTLQPTEQFDLYTVNADGSGLFQVTNTPDLQEGGVNWGTHPLLP
jgi:Tol biopolymer transport system component